jgi:endonuclease-3 related protein
LALSELLSRWGRQNWWPAESPFEVAVGAILVQNTAWRNADLAIANLRANNLLAPVRLATVTAGELETLIRPAGFQRQKTQTLLALAGQVTSASPSFDGFLERPTLAVREELLKIRGIGPETADSILLYGGGHEIFVVDVYLRRFLVGLGFDALSRSRYDALRAWTEALVHDESPAFSTLLTTLRAETPSHPLTPMSGAPRSAVADIYNELHAILVRDGVEKRRPGANAPGRGKSR